jgi:hypothetical protein
MLVSPGDDHLEGKFLSLIAALLWLRAHSITAQRVTCLSVVSTTGLRWNVTSSLVSLEMHGSVRVAQHETTHKKSGSLQNLECG